MEGILLVLLGAFQAAFLAALSVLSAIATMVGTLIGWLFNAVVPARFGRRGVGSGSSPLNTGRQRRSRLLRNVGFTLAAVTGLLVAAVAILNGFFFEPIAQRLIGSQAERIGARFESEAIEGNLFTGRFEIRGTRIAAEHGSLSIDELSLDIAIPTLLLKKKTLESARVTGMKLDAMLPPSDGSDLPPSVRSIPNVKVAELALNDIDVSLTSASGPPPPVRSLRIDRLTCSGFRTRAALFYLFFRSQAEMEVNGSSLVIDVESREPQGKRTIWRAEGLPLAGFRQASPFFSLFQEGTIDLEVRDEWTLSDRLEVDADWSLTLRDVRASAGPDQPLLRAAADFLNRAEAPIEIGFQLRMNPEEFEGSATESADALFAAISRAALAAIGRRGIDPEAVEQRKSRLFDRAKGLLDEARKEP